MIEEIQALMPLFEKISDGALTAFVAYLAAQVFPKILIALIWAAAIYFTLKAAIPALTLLKHGHPTKSGPTELDLYHFTINGTEVGEVRYVGEVNKIEALFKEIEAVSDSEEPGPYSLRVNFGSDCLYSVDVEGATKILKAHREHRAQS